MLKLLFLCSRNRLRSPTAEYVFASWPHVSTDSAGLSRDANVVLSSEQIENADLIFVMEPIHQQKLKQKFGRLLRSKKVICLHIPDNYAYMQPELIQLLEQKVSPFLPRLHPVC